MGKHPKWFWFFNAIALTVVVVFVTVTPLREWAHLHVTKLYHWLKEYLAALFAAFFLVKGKFVLKIFLKKIALISATGLTKRYLIEKVFTYHLKVHFFAHIKRDVTRLFRHIKRNFMRFPLTKKLIALFAFLGSLSYVAKFMGTVLAIKVMMAKLWSFLLAWVLKVGNAVVYFLTDYVWGSWLAPLIEVVVFGWILSWLEKVPYLKEVIFALYRLFRRVMHLFDFVAERVLHLPLRRIFRFLVRQTREMIYRFIGYTRPPIYIQLRELRKMRPSFRNRLKARREAYSSTRRKPRQSRYEELKQTKKRYVNKSDVSSRRALRA